MDPKNSIIEHIDMEPPIKKKVICKTKRESESVHATPQELLKWMNEQSLSYKTYRHPAIHTVEEARRLRGDLTGAYVKNLFLRDRDQSLYLLTCLSDRQVNLQWLRQQIGCRRLSFASSETLYTHLGVHPGSVSPLALFNTHPTKVRFFLDHTLLQYEVNNLHPLTNEMTVQLNPHDLLMILKEWGFITQWVVFDD